MQVGRFFVLCENLLSIERLDALFTLIAGVVDVGTDGEDAHFVGGIRP
jgi:hypothetical protein